MTTKTRADLIARALATLVNLPSGQTPSSEDSSTVDEHIDSVLATLSSKGVVTINDPDEIEVEVFGPLAKWLIEDCASEFGGVADPKAMLLAEAEIRKVVYGRPTREPLSVDYY